MIYHAKYFLIEVIHYQPTPAASYSFIIKLSFSSLECKLRKRNLKYHRKREKSILKTTCLLFPLAHMVFGNTKQIEQVLGEIVS